MKDYRDLDMGNVWVALLGFCLHEGSGPMVAPIDMDRENNVLNCRGRKHVCHSEKY